MFVSRGFGYRFFVLMIAFRSLGCTSNNARDSHCSPDSPDRDTDPECIYAGKGSGPPFVEPICVEPVPTGSGGNGGDAVTGGNGGNGGSAASGGNAANGGNEPAPAACPTFYDVVDVIADPTKGNCSSNGCHGLESNAASAIFLPIVDPTAFYDSLTKATGTVGRPYVVPDDPATSENEALTSWIGCSLRGDRGGGYPMPPPAGMDRADIAIVSAWLVCGAPPPQECPAVGTDNECTACAKASCCGQVVKCTADAMCAPCAACVVDNGDPSMCSAECDQDNARVAALFSCAAGNCDTECPGVAE